MRMKNLDAIMSESDNTADDDTSSRMPVNVDVRAPKPGQRKKAQSNLSQKQQEARKSSMMQMKAGQVEKRPPHLSLETTKSWFKLNK